jgi:hypothetical protein
MPSERPWYRPRLTRARVIAAFVVAIAADALQIVLGPFGWFLADQVIDVVAMAATSLALGFHVLLLPTVVLEFLPLTNLWPTWTGCVAAVVALRRDDLRRDDR